MLPLLPPGTTWLMEIAYLVCNNADIISARSRHLYERAPFIEATMPQTGSTGEPIVQFDYILRQPPPRVLKTHLGLKFFERSIRKSGTKVLIPIRNPKDTLVSMYHFYQLVPTLGVFTASWDQFFEHLFVKKRLVFGDYFDFYEAWGRYRTENPDQVLFVRYEDMKRDISEAIRTVTRFLGKSLTEEQVASIKEHTTFESMKKNDNVCPAPEAPRELFFRKGQVGEWVNYFSKSQAEYVDRLVKERLEPLGLHVYD